MIHRSADRIDGSRAFGPGSRTVRLAVVTALVSSAVVAGACFLWPSATPAADRYGGLPSWLPKAKIPVGRRVTASAAHPWLAVQGDTVSVDLARGRVLATAVGPVVPEEGQFPVPETSPCTFNVTFTAASGAVPLSAKAFTIVDEDGRLHRPHVTGSGGGPPPSGVRPGQTVTLTVKDVIPTGDGSLRWTPEGTAPIVSWDFDVEID
jgi:hypothetical protein